MYTYRAGMLYSGATKSFKDVFSQMQEDLLDQDPFARGEWQSQKIEQPMRELRHVVMEMPLPDGASELAQITGAHLPWAEDHFAERVGGEPLNPSPSEAWWPFAQKGNAAHKSEGVAFSHTYPERMWPKHAAPEGNLSDAGTGTHQGIRFAYGDLLDVVHQLIHHPLTRQAYLPIWFPEDTGAVHGKRVPCTLGYHFLIADGKMDITYFMRSTDLLRHFQDDIYLAGRLAQWVVNQVNLMAEPVPPSYELEIGNLIFHTANLHIFDGDVPMINYRKSQGQHAWPE